MSGMSAARVQRPMRTKIEQTTSAKMARSSAVRCPVPKGSRNELESAELDHVLLPGMLPVAKVTEGTATIGAIFREMDAFLSAESVLVPEVANAFATVLTVLFYENFRLANQFSKDKKLRNLLIREVLVYLNENYKEKITLESLSKKFRASVSCIAHEFAKEYGISPINYVIQRRITEAKFALTTTSESLNQIAWKVGYENTYHFSKLFLRHVDCSPTDYRKKFNHQHDEGEGAREE